VAPTATETAMDATRTGLGPTPFSDGQRPRRPEYPETMSDIAAAHVLIAGSFSRLGGGRLGERVLSGASDLD
jgi:hypothetical protein